MSYSIFAHHYPERGCEFTVTDSRSGSLVTSLGAVGCSVGKRPGDIVRDVSTATSYGEVRKLVSEFYSDHARVSEDAVSPVDSRTYGVTLTEADLGPEERSYRAAAAFLTGQLELPAGIDRGMLLDAVTNGPQLEELLAANQSTIAE